MTNVQNLIICDWFRCYSNEHWSYIGKINRFGRTMYTMPYSLYCISLNYWQIQKKFEDDEVASILDRATRNCPWSGDLWGLSIRFLAQLDSYPLEKIGSLKAKAISTPWMTERKQEL